MTNKMWQGKTRGGVAGYKTFYFILKYLGLKPAYFILRFVVLYFLIFSKKQFIFGFYHKILNFSISSSFFKLCRNYYIFGQILLDKAALLAGCPNKFTFDFDGEEYLRQMKNGGLLISAHIGNWEIAGQLLERLESRFNIVMFDAEHERIKNYLDDVLVKKKLNVIVIKDDLSHIIEIQKALTNGELVCLHGDRFVPGSKTMKFNFLGKEANFPTGPFFIASRFDVPVSFVFAMKESESHYHFYATPLRSFYNPNRKSRDEHVAAIAKEYIGELESKVRLYPEQWFNYYDFWGAIS